MLGRSNFEKLFKVFKADNGSEFSNPLRIEFDKENKRRSNLFYCDPYASYQKGGVEQANSISILTKGLI